jgi:hypothetical protein
MLVTNPDGSLSWNPAAAMPGSEPMFNSLQGLSQPTTAPNTPGGVPTAPLGYTSFSQAGGIGNYIGANAPLFSAGLNALSQGVGIYTGLKSLSLAKKSFNLQKDAYQTNLRNQTQSYNTQVQDRIAGRSYATEAERQAALQAAMLPTGG